MKKVLDIGVLRPATVPQVIMEVMKVLEIGLKIPANLPKLIVEVVDIGQA